MTIACQQPINKLTDLLREQVSFILILSFIGHGITQCNVF